MFGLSNATAARGCVNHGIAEIVGRQTYRRSNFALEVRIRRYQILILPNQAHSGRSEDNTQNQQSTAETFSIAAIEKSNASAERQVVR